MSNLTVTLKGLLLNTTSAIDSTKIKWEPPFHRNVEKASAILSYLVTIYIIWIFCFAMIKCTVTHGWQLWMIHKPGVSHFAQRPELVVFCCSTIPTVITVLGRSAWKTYHGRDITIGYEWGSCQTVLFFDIWSRTAALYHMIYWTYQGCINSALYRAHLRRLDLQHGTNPERELEQRLAKIDRLQLKLKKRQQSQQFKKLCKHRIPGLIYLLAFIVAMPILITATKDVVSETPSTIDGSDTIETFAVCQKIPAYDFYHYYDLVALITVPLIAMTTRFYLAALNPDKRRKMKYRLRCYHVVFILLNIPIFVLNIIHEAFAAVHSEELTKARFANGILIALTAYHTAFAIKPLVHTTGCNCICCGDTCLRIYPRVNRWVLYWSTPQQKNKNVYSEPIQVTID